MLRLLLLSHEYPPLGGGVANTIFYLLKEFARIPTITVELITVSSDQFIIQQLSPSIKIHFLDLGKRGDTRYQSYKDWLLYIWKAQKYTKHLYRHTRFDGIHAFMGLPSGYIAMHSGLPYIVSLRGSDVPFQNPKLKIVDSILLQRISRKIWKKARTVLALSNDSARLAHYTSPDQEISVIYNGVDTDAFSPIPETSKPDKTFDILFIGRLELVKGWVYLLQAFQELAPRYPQLRLHIVGDGSLKEVFIKRYKSLDCRAQILYHEKFAHHQLPSLYQKAHVFVLPSLNEALGNVALEALASGLPIITTNTGTSELVNGNGFVIQKHSSQEIAQSIERLLRDPVLRNTMAHKSREIAENMTWRRCAKKHLQVYQHSFQHHV